MSATGFHELEEAPPKAMTSRIEGDLMEVSMGPQHPSTHGVFRMNVALDGEVVRKLKPVFGYLHRNHEKIGENTIQGLQTIGMRDTTTINVGIIGNDREFSIVREFWYSPKLGFNLLSSLRDARHGTQTFKMTELTEAEPEAAWFEMPQGYTLSSSGTGIPAIR